MQSKSTTWNILVDKNSWTCVRAWGCSCFLQACAHVHAWLPMWTNSDSFQSTRLSHSVLSRLVFFFLFQTRNKLNSEASRAGGNDDLRIESGLKKIFWQLFIQQFPFHTYKPLNWIIIPTDNGRETPPLWDKEQIKLPLYSSIWSPLFHHDTQDPNWHMFSSNLGLCWGLLWNCLYLVSGGA